MRTQTGFVLEAPHGLEALARADTVVVPGWASPDLVPRPALVYGARCRTRARRAASSRSARARSFSPPAGLLDGRRAATHWLYADLLQERYPEVQVDASVLYIADEDIMTSGGTAAGIDLCLQLVAFDHGVEAAAAVSRRMLMPLHRSGGQAQYVDMQVTAASGDAVESLLHWGLANLAAGVSVDDLARRGAVSHRTLTRHFRAAIGLAPGEWLQRERLRLAQRLLETTSDPIESVARRAGYDTSSAMRAQFTARLRTSPRAYRRTFRG